MKKRSSKPKRIQAVQKMHNYLQAQIVEPDFNEKVKKIRLRYGIPIDGLKEVLSDQFFFKNNLPKHVFQNGDESSFEKEISDLAYSVDLDVPWLPLIEDYVLYDDFSYSSVNSLIELIDFEDFLNQQAEIDEDEELTIDEKVNSLRNLADTFPIGLFISPYASQRDIIDFIKKKYKTDIQPLQKNYSETGVKIGRIRKSNADIQERNNFINKNAHLKGREIVSLLRDRMKINNMDYTYINKIKARNRKHK